MRFSCRLLSLALSSAAWSSAHAAGLAHVRFIVVDPKTGSEIPGTVLVENHGTAVMVTTGTPSNRNVSLDTNLMRSTESANATIVRIPAGQTVKLTQNQTTPTKEIVIRVTATRLIPNKAPVSASGSNRSRSEIQKFVNTTQADTRQLTKGQAGVAEDSAGQQHVRGEHTSITYVIDGVPLPDTLSGRQGSVVVPSTIQNLEIITGGFAPEFGGQTAAVLNVTTLPSFTKAHGELTLEGGDYRTRNGDLTAQGPLGKHGSFVLNLNATHTNLFEEATQPDDQTAHNEGGSESAFVKLRFAPNKKDDFSFTVSGNPDHNQIGNRTGLPSSFASVGQGYGLFGLRNADGSRPDVTSENSGLLGAQNIKLASQDAAGQDIYQREVTEFATLNFQHKVNARESFLFAATIMHSGQDVNNHNPSADLLNLPVDNSIEYNPTVSRNVHHVQLVGNYAATSGSHQLKAGFIVDNQDGDESYKVEAASQLALDALAALEPSLAPAGSAGSDLDINGYPVYTASGSTSPTLKVHRTGTYKAVYAQDTWKLGHLTSNYGARLDWYQQSQNLSSDDLNASEFSPRLNFSYTLNKRTELHWAYNHIFNTPPLAQGALVGQAIQPEIIDQYDLGITQQVKSNQKITLAYYAKQIKNQVDVGLLIPGSQIGLYSGVNLERGGVHGIEFSYEISAPKGVGWDSYVNYSYSAARPNGVDNTGAEVDDYNDHDQRNTVGAGLAYTWKSGSSVALTYQYGSGLASSVVPPSNYRTPRDEFDLRISSGDRMFQGKGGLTLDIENLFDKRNVMNFQSAFSGTRFQMARRIGLSASFKF